MEHPIGKCRFEERQRVRASAHSKAQVSKSNHRNLNFLIMKLSRSLLLPVFISAASALSDASVYIFQGEEWPNTSTPPSLSPEQARLVFAQRLGASRYHTLGGADDSTLQYINTFGRHGESVFNDAGKDKAAELVLIIEGVTSRAAEQLLEEWPSFTPAFTISSPPSSTANKRLVDDLSQQCGGSKACALEDAVNPLNAKCWNGKSNIIHVDLNSAKELMSVQERLARFSKNQEMNVVMVFLPEESRSSKTKTNPYGLYDRVSQAPIGRRGEVSEEPMTEHPSVQTTPLQYSNKIQSSKVSGNASMKPITGIPKLCHADLDSCISATNNCSGHGNCYKKYGEDKGACFTCFCKANSKTFKIPGSKDGTRTTMQYWGGSACQKEDVSTAFWLIFLFTFTIIGITGWAISMLYSIGEEKLPGVIGAGVSSKTK